VHKNEQMIFIFIKQMSCNLFVGTIFLVVLINYYTSPIFWGLFGVLFVVWVIYEYIDDRKTTRDREILFQEIEDSRKRDNKRDADIAARGGWFIIDEYGITQNEPGHCNITELKRHISEKEKQIIKINMIQKCDLVSLIIDLIETKTQKVLIVDSVTRWDYDFDYYKNVFENSVVGNYVHIKNTYE
jgi:hypothetical protein